MVGDHEHRPGRRDALGVPVAEPEHQRGSRVHDQDAEGHGEVHGPPGAPSPRPTGGLPAGASGVRGRLLRHGPPSVPGRCLAWSSRCDPAHDRPSAPARSPPGPSLHPSGESARRTPDPAVCSHGQVRSWSVVVPAKRLAVAKTRLRPTDHDPARRRARRARARAAGRHRGRRESLPGGRRGRGGHRRPRRDGRGPRPRRAHGRRRARPRPEPRPRARGPRGGRSARRRALLRPAGAAARRAGPGPGRRGHDGAPLLRAPTPRARGRRCSPPWIPIWGPVSGPVPPGRTVRAAPGPCPGRGQAWCRTSTPRPTSGRRRRSEWARAPPPSWTVFGGPAQGPDATGTAR